MAHANLSPRRTPHKLRPGRMLVMDTEGRLRYAKPDHILDAARYVLRDKLAPGTFIENPSNAGRWVAVYLGGRDREVFMALYLDARHRLIESRDLFCGTVDQCAVYPREIARAALALNAVAVVVAHNHPSGSLEPSAMDEMVTYQIRTVLELIDVKLLDHIIVANGEHVSMASKGIGGFEPETTPRRTASRRRGRGKG